MKQSEGIVEKVEQVLWSVEKYGALQCGSVGEEGGGGGMGVAAAVEVVGNAKAMQEEEKS